MKTPSPLAPRLLSLKEAANWLGLSIWAMRERVWAGDIPVVRFKGGRKIYVDVQDAEKLIRDNKERIT
jgi:predicted site-specific integrase-resolvase